MNQWLRRKKPRNQRKKPALQFVRNPVDGFPYPTVPWAELNPEWLSCDSSGKLI